MYPTVAEPLGIEQTGDSAGIGICVGKLVGLNSNGQALVDFPGNMHGPVEAKTVTGVFSDGSLDGQLDIAVLLAFEQHDPIRPVIIGRIADTLVGGGRPSTKQESTKHVSVDGKKSFVIEAEEEIVLRCGRSSLTLRNDGKVVVKGAHIVSRASRSNRIKGGTVAIN